MLVADDHPVVRQGLRSFLDTREGIEVVGEAADGEEAVELAASLRPDVVLMDLVMPGGGGLAAIRRLAEVAPGARVLVLTSFSSDDQVIPAIQAGAAGYLLKDAHPSQVEEAIRTVGRGERLLDPQVAAVVMAEVAQPRSAAPGARQARRHWPSSRPGRPRCWRSSARASRTGTWRPGCSCRRRRSRPT